MTNQIRPYEPLTPQNAADLTSELEMNAEQQARDFHTDEYRNRVANYLPDHYA